MNCLYHDNVCDIGTFPGIITSNYIIAIDEVDTQYNVQNNLISVDFNEFGVPPGIIFKQLEYDSQGYYHFNVEADLYLGAEDIGCTVLRGYTIEQEYMFGLARKSSPTSMYYDIDLHGIVVKTAEELKPGYYYFKNSFQKFNLIQFGLDQKETTLTTYRRKGEPVYGLAISKHRLLKL